MMRLQHVSEQVSTPDSKQVLQINTHSHNKAHRKWKILAPKLADGIHHTMDR